MPAAPDAVRLPLVSPVPGTGPIAAVLFDLDGTLYRQRPVRARMAWELALSTIFAPAGAVGRWRGLQAFRQAQESMRQGGAPATLAAQIATAAASSGIAEDRLRALVDEWMFERPSRFLARYLAEGTRSLLDFLDSRGIPVGLFSDYPAASKLRGLDLEGRFSPIVCSTDAAVGAFKPDPRGFHHACRTWNLDPSQVLFVGDRIEVDAIGAAAAGMPCVIVGRPHPSVELPAATVVLPSLERLYRVFVDGR
jgi:HAD superfamily hydrolase (TIGR01549 family)